MKISSIFQNCQLKNVISQNFHQFQIKNPDFCNEKRIFWGIFRKYDFRLELVFDFDQLLSVQNKNTNICKNSKHCIIYVFKGCLFIPVYNVSCCTCTTHLQFRPKVYSKSQLTHCVLRKKLILVTMLFILLQKSWEKHLIFD